jgi:glycosyltransferase involved in cell wall biosynthesis
MLDSSGVGKYLQGCLPFFFKSKNNFLLLGNQIQLEKYISNNEIKIVNYAKKPFSIFELFFIPKKIINLINKTDAFFTPFFNIISGISIPVYCTIHDIIFPDFPELVSKIGLDIRLWFYRRAYKKSKLIFTVSEFSKSRIIHHLGKEKQIIVTYSGVQSDFFKKRIQSKKIKKKDTIVFIGNIKKHKGLDCLIKAFFYAKSAGLQHQLIIIGNKDHFRSYDTILKNDINSHSQKDVLFTGSITDEQLIEYISNASLLIQPSLYEGFGLPPLEAMILGTKALISDIQVFKEIYSEFPVTYFKVNDYSDLKSKIMELIHEKSPIYVSLSNYLMEKYSFQKTASIILNNIEKCSISQ